MAEPEPQPDPEPEPEPEPQPQPEPHASEAEPEQPLEPLPAPPRVTIRTGTGAPQPKEPEQPEPAQPEPPPPPQQQQQPEEEPGPAHEPEAEQEPQPQPEPEPEVGPSLPTASEASLWSVDSGEVALERPSSADSSCSRESFTGEVRFGSTYFRRIMPEPLAVSRDQNVMDHFRAGGGLVGVLDPAGVKVGKERAAREEVRRRREALLAARAVSDELNRRPRIGDRTSLGNFDLSKDVEYELKHSHQSDAARKEASAYRERVAQQQSAEFWAEDGYEGELAPRGLIIPAPAAGFYAWFGEQSQNAGADGQVAVAKWWHHPADDLPGRGGAAGGWAEREDSDYLEVSRPLSAASSRPGSAGSAVSANVSVPSVEMESVDLAGRVRPASAASRLSSGGASVAASERAQSEMSFDSVASSSGSAAGLRVPKAVAPSRTSFRSSSAGSSRSGGHRPVSASSSFGAAGTRRGHVELWRTKQRKGKDLAAIAGPAVKGSRRGTYDWAPSTTATTAAAAAATAGASKGQGEDQWDEVVVGATTAAAGPQRPRTAAQLYAEHRARQQRKKAKKRGGSQKPKGTGQLRMDLEDGKRAGLLMLLSQSTVW